MKFKVEALTWKRNILKNKMFHLALYFDEKTNQKFSFLNKKVEKELHQNYLENHHIPFHLTIATYKEIEEKKFIEQANQLFEKESSQELYFVSLGCFQKSTFYLLPVYNEFLNQLILKIYQTFDEYKMQGEGAPNKNPFVYVKRQKDTIDIVTSNDRKNFSSRRYRL